MQRASTTYEQDWNPSNIGAKIQMYFSPFIPHKAAASIKKMDAATKRGRHLNVRPFGYLPNTMDR